MGSKLVENIGLFFHEGTHTGTQSLREKCPNTEFFLIGIEENTDQKKLRNWILFMQ